MWSRKSKKIKLNKIKLIGLPDNSNSSSTLPIATISSRSSDTHRGIGVPQNRLRDIAQSFASANLEKKSKMMMKEE